jgi:hypothetical protein
MRDRCGVVFLMTLMVVTTLGAYGSPNPVAGGSLALQSGAASSLCDSPNKAGSAVADLFGPAAVCSTPKAAATGCMTSCDTNNYGLIFCVTCCDCCTFTVGPTQCECSTGCAPR